MPFCVQNTDKGLARFHHSESEPPSYKEHRGPQGFRPSELYRIEILTDLAETLSSKHKLKDQFQHELDKFSSTLSEIVEQSEDAEELCLAIEIGSDVAASRCKEKIQDGYKKLIDTAESHHVQRATHAVLAAGINVGKEQFNHLCKIVENGLWQGTGIRNLAVALSKGVHSRSAKHFPESHFSDTGNLFDAVLHQAVNSVDDCEGDTLISLIKYLGHRSVHCRSTTQEPFHTLGADEKKLIDATCQLYSRTSPTELPSIVIYDAVRATYQMFWNSCYSSYEPTRVLFRSLVETLCEAWNKDRELGKPIFSRNVLDAIEMAAYPKGLDIEISEQLINQIVTSSGIRDTQLYGQHLSDAAYTLVSVGHIEDAKHLLDGAKLDYSSFYSMRDKEHQAKLWCVLAATDTFGEYGVAELTNWHLEQDDSLGSREFCVCNPVAIIPAKSRKIPDCKLETNLLAGPYKIDLLVHTDSGGVIIGRFNRGILRDPTQAAREKTHLRVQKLIFESAGFRFVPVKNIQFERLSPKERAILVANLVLTPKALEPSDFNRFVY